MISSGRRSGETIGIAVAVATIMEITQSLAQHGAGLVFANVLAQQLGVPVPAEPTLVLAGALAARGMLSPVRVVAATVAATAIADAVWFLLGRRYDRKVTRVLSCPKSNQAQGESRFARWGVRSLLLARFLPGAVQLIVPLAGARHVKLGSFLFYDLTGIVLWASVPVTGGMLFHHQAETLLQALSGGALWFAVAALAVAIIVMVRRRRSGKDSSQWAPRA